MRNKQLVIGMAVLTLLLAGCAQGSKADSTGTVSASNTNEGGTAANGANSDSKAGGSVLTETERQMMSTFQALIAMDKQEGLSITKAQAEKMLPQVEKSVTAGELTADDKKSLESLLTAEQTTFYSKFASGGGQRAGMQGQGQQGQGQGQRGQGTQGQGQGQPGQGQSGQGQKPNNQGNQAPTGSPSPNGNGRPQSSGNPPQGGNFQRPNVESQLVELLKGKINA
jgi:hypothetical protein